MDTFEATMIAEGQFELAGIAEDDVTEELQIEAWQHLVDTGICWQLQGAFGRQAQAMIDAGLLTAEEH